MDFPYGSVKFLHVACVITTIALLEARVRWADRSPERSQRRWVKVVPHLIDTVLLLSGVALAWQLGAAGVRGWLPAKLIALVLYIALGAAALRYGRTRGARNAAGVGAVVVFAYMVAVALTKSPTMGW